MVCTSCKNSYNVLSLSGIGRQGVGGGDAKERVATFWISRGLHLCGQCGALDDGFSKGSYGYICCS